MLLLEHLLFLIISHLSDADNCPLLALPAARGRMTTKRKFSLEIPHMINKKLMTERQGRCGSCCRCEKKKFGIEMHTQFAQFVFYSNIVCSLWCSYVLKPIKDFFKKETLMEFYSIFFWFNRNIHMLCMLRTSLYLKISLIVCWNTADQGLTDCWQLMQEWDYIITASKQEKMMAGGGSNPHFSFAFSNLIQDIFPTNMNIFITCSTQLAYVSQTQEIFFKVKNILECRT